jgi:hypothetical protein
MNSNIHFWLHLTHFFLEQVMFQTKVLEKIKIHILCSIMFIKKSCHLWDNVEKYGTAGEATDDNMVCVHFTLCTWGYKYTLSEYVILIAFPQQQWLHKCVSTLHYTYTACLIIFTPCLEHLYVIQNVCNHTDLSHTHTFSLVICLHNAANQYAYMNFININCRHQLY